MNPSELANELRSIASKIDASDSPVKYMVKLALDEIVAEVSETPDEIMVATHPKLPKAVAIRCSGEAEAMDTLNHILIESGMSEEEASFVVTECEWIDVDTKLSSL